MHRILLANSVDSDIFYFLQKVSIKVGVGQVGVFKINAQGGAHL